MTRKSSGLISIVLFFIIIFLLIITGKNITIGMIVAIIQNILNQINIITNNLSDTVNSISHDYNKSIEIKEFFNFEEDNNSTSKYLINSEFIELEFKHVYFKYPNSVDYTLNDLNFKIKKNHNYSFVGENGCGKSTIIKLILGFYDNYEGNI